MANILPFDRQVEIIAALTEGVSIRAVERQNLKPRVSQRRFTRLTNAFSEKLEQNRNGARRGASVAPPWRHAP